MTSLEVGILSGIAIQNPYAGVAVGVGADWADTHANITGKLTEYNTTGLYLQSANQMYISTGVVSIFEDIGHGISNWWDSIPKQSVDEMCDEYRETHNVGYRR